MIIGITGINGFIGKNVSNELNKQGHTTVSLDGFVRDKEDVNLMKFNHLDWVFHFGAKTSIADSLEDPAATISNNLGSSLQALVIAERYRANVIYLSSYIYGPPKYIPIDEDHEIEPNNPYMVSKYLGEMISKNFCQFCNLRLIILRAFNIYGFLQKPGRLISDLLHAHLNRTQFELFDPDSRRDYLYIKDFNTLIQKIINGKDDSEGIFNVGFGKSYSNLEVARLFRSLTGNSMQFVERNIPRPNEIDECVANISKISKMFSWEPTYSLSEGLIELVKEIDENKFISEKIV